MPFGELNTISTTPVGPQALVTADLDGDGDIDVLTASTRDERIDWYENRSGDGSSWTTRTISSALMDDSPSVFVADVDGDGDLDVLSGSKDPDSFNHAKFAWYENDGTPASGSQVSTNVPAWHSIRPVLSLHSPTPQVVGVGA